jgi:hypothetical protein
MASYIEYLSSECRRHGAALDLGAAVTAIDEAGGRMVVRCYHGAKLELVPKDCGTALAAEGMAAGPAAEPAANAGFQQPPDRRGGSP